MKKVILRFELSRRKNLYDEYVVRCFLDEKRYIEGYYYTDEWGDAYSMIERLAREFGLNISELDNNLIVAI